MENRLETRLTFPTRRRALPLNGAASLAPRRASHEAFMAAALALARKGAGWTSPNPAVGAVVVRQGRVVGAGYHRRAGAAHAEVEALRQAGRRARGSTVYVTLEPCNHAGRTPPCCEAILAAGVRRVVAAMRDPNPITNGRGLARLRRAGIEVITGVLEAEAHRLNEPFHKAMTSTLPFVIAKIGQSLDGKIATTTGASRWITSPASRRAAHRWRARVDAILIGATTARRDDPALTVRGVRHRPGRPVKVIVDTHLRLPLGARCVSAASPAKTIIATAVRQGAKRAALLARGVEVLSLPARRGRVPLRPLLRRLLRADIQSVLLEGGGELLASALAERLVDRIVFVVAPLLIGGRTTPTSVGGPGIAALRDAVRLTDVVITPLGPDWCLEARVVYPKTGARGTGHGAGVRTNTQSHAPRPTPHTPR